MLLEKLSELARKAFPFFCFFSFFRKKRSFWKAFRACEESFSFFFASFFFFRKRKKFATSYRGSSFMSFRGSEERRARARREAQLRCLAFRPASFADQQENAANWQPSFAVRPKDRSQLAVRGWLSFLLNRQKRSPAKLLPISNKTALLNEWQDGIQHQMAAKQPLVTSNQLPGRL